MRSVSRLTLFVPLAVLAISCASSEQLARRSDAELKSGQTERAYQTAVVALKHKPGNPTAIAALNRAAAVLAEGRRARVRRLAATDTLPAAREALDLESFRHEVTRLGGDVPDDPGFASDEHAIRDAAAALDYASAERALHEDQAKDAYRWFAEVNRFHAGFRDVSRRLDDTYARAEVRLAVLPFEDADEVPSIALAVRAHLWDQLARHLRPDQLSFTRLIEPQELDEMMTVSEADHMTRERAVALGRRIGARRVLWGRIYGVQPETFTDTWHGTIYHRIQERDTSGREIVRDVPQDFHAMRREAHLALSVDLEVIDVNTEQPVESKTISGSAAARTMFTSVLPDVDVERYSLVSREMRDRDPGRSGEIERSWHEQFGSCTLPHMLETAGSNRSRGAYRHEYMDLFEGNTLDQPVFLDDLPSPGDLAILALRNVWHSALDQIKSQDLK